MAQFKAGDVVEVYGLMPSGFRSWRPATIESRHDEKYLVKFVNGSLGEFTPDDIKPVLPGQNADRYAAYLNRVY